MKALWTTDIHLNFCDQDRLDRFLDDLRDTESDCALVGGDIAEAPALTDRLREIGAAVARPVYFVLGNHDFYDGSIEEVRQAVSALCVESPGLIWLGESGVIPLSDQTCLIGHGGWGDARLGSFWGSQVKMNDFTCIREISLPVKEDRLEEIHALGDEAANYLQGLLPSALDQYAHVVVLTHVPPFKGAAWHRGHQCDEGWLPFMTCKAVGTVLIEAMQQHLDRRMTVLCGHTHGKGFCQPFPNLEVHTGGARYGRPKIQRVFEWD